MIFSFENVSYRYQSNADFSLSGINLSIDSTRVTGLAGENGSGKTTLIHILLRQLVDLTGTYTIDSSPATDIRADFCSQYRIGYAPGIPVLEERLTGFEILSLIARIRGCTKSQEHEQIQMLQSYLRMGSWFTDKPCSEYSQGMRKAVSIACAFVGRVQFAVLDEPLNGLDPVVIHGMNDLITHMKSIGIGVLISSHILDFIERTADSCILLRKGKLLYSGEMKDLLAQNPGQRLDQLYLKLFSGDEA